VQNKQPVLRTEDMLSEADIMLPAQYFEAMGSAGLSGEQRLMLAVIVDAINVLQSWKGAGSARKRRDFGEAAQWVNIRGTSHPFTFDSVCDALGIDSGQLRSRLSVLTTRPANSARRVASVRLRLKELSRSQRMTATSPGRRKRDCHMMIETSNQTPAPAPWQITAEQAQDCIA
jgi:hypothetical protein